MPEYTHLIYTSVPFGYNSADLNGILVDARWANARDAVTGALICRHDLYMQYLEGPADAVSATLARIQKDDRHVEVTLRYEGVVSERLFGDWAMLHDPSHSQIWTAQEVSAGALERASPLDYLYTFNTLAVEAAAA